VSSVRDEESEAESGTLNNAARLCAP